MPRCDCCEEEWEDAFFCKKCSSKAVTMTETVPDTMWDYDDRTPEYIERDYTTTLDVCMNCCTCHLR